MKILIAEDERVTRRMLETVLAEWGYETVVACDGLTAWQALQASAPPQLALLDWLMPGMEGLEVCRRARELPTRQPTYLILLTVKGNRQDIVAGLQSGADDYVTKPFDPEELQARIQTGLRIVQLQHRLSDKVEELEGALARVKQLQGLLPICCYCKCIRDSQDYWQQVEAYITDHSEARFSHGVCPRCYASHIEPELQKMRAAAGKDSPIRSLCSARRHARRPCVAPGLG